MFLTAHRSAATGSRLATSRSVRVAATYVVQGPSSGLALIQIASRRFRSAGWISPISGAQQSVADRVVRVGRQLPRDHAHVVLDQRRRSVHRVVRLEHGHVDQLQPVAVVAGCLVPDAVLQADTSFRRPSGTWGRTRAPGAARVVGVDDVAVVDVAVRVLVDRLVADVGPGVVRDGCGPAVRKCCTTSCGDSVGSWALFASRSKLSAELNCVFSADDDLARERVGVVDDAPDQAAQQVDVGAAALGPLVVDLDHDDVVGPDDTAGTGGQRRRRGVGGA